MRIEIAAGLVATVVLALAACSSSSEAAEHQFYGSVATPSRTVDDFVLTDQDGGEFHLAQRTAPAALIFFGYGLCPDVCPTALADLVRVKRALGDRAEDVDIIMVTVDPERDSPDVLRQRLAVFDPEFIGLTGDREDLQRVWKDFGVIAKRETGADTAAGYLVAHTAFTYLVDQELRLRVTFPFPLVPEDTAADVAYVLNEMEAF